MPTVLIRYKLKRDQVDTELELLRAVYVELAEQRPEGLRYATFQLDDEVSFVDLVEGPDLPEPLPRLAAFARYRAGHDERCEEPAMMTTVRAVGSYGFASP